MPSVFLSATSEYCIPPERLSHSLSPLPHPVQPTPGYPLVVIPHLAPPIYTEPIRQGRFASTIVLNSPELAEDPAARSLITKCSVALLGIPDDTGVEMNRGRLGAAQGPHAFRAALARYGAAAPFDDSPSTLPHPAYPRLFDAGDIIPGASLDETHNRVTAAAAALLDLGLFPIAVGGGHDLTFPFVRAAAQKFGPLEGVYFDAHLDVRPEPGSGMSFRALLEGGLASRLHAVGIDPLSNTREHHAYFTQKGCSLAPFAPERWRDTITSDRQFVSLDLDVLDMAFAPGVSAMNPCGMSSAAVGAYIDAAGRNLAVRCFDIMELSPPHDENGRTARLAAHLFLRFLRAFASRASA